MSREPELTNRRRFLKDMAAVGGAATLAVVAGPCGAVGSEQGVHAAPAEPSRPKGYRLTPHIRDYYAKASL